MIRFKLKQLLIDKHMTQSELAIITGIRKPTLVQLNQGTTKQLPIYALDAICKSLNCSVSDIIEYIPDNGT